MYLLHSKWWWVVMLEKRQKLNQSPPLDTPMYIHKSEFSKKLCTIFLMIGTQCSARSDGLGWGVGLLHVHSCETKLRRSGVTLGVRGLLHSTQCSQQRNMIVLCGFEQLEATAKTGDRFRISFHIAASFSFFSTILLLLSTIILYSDGLNFKTSYFAEGDEHK